MNRVNPHKIYKTATGYPVRIYAVDGEGPFPIHGAIQTDDGWEPASWTDAGKYRATLWASGLDLVEVITDDMPF